jgi:hypothetical protein
MKLLNISLLLSICLTLTSCQNINRNGDNISLNHQDDLSPLGKKLKDEGRPDDEVYAFMQLERENDYLTAPIGEVVRIPGHFVYFVDGKRRDGRQTCNACGIWAVRRKLRHMILSGKYKDISNDAWYRDSDAAIRQKLSEVTFNEPSQIRKNGEIDSQLIVWLQRYYGINDMDNIVRCANISKQEIFVPTNSGDHGFNYTNKYEYGSPLNVTRFEN